MCIYNTHTCTHTTHEITYVGNYKCDYSNCLNTTTVKDIAVLRKERRENEGLDETPTGSLSESELSEFNSTDATMEDIISLKRLAPIEDNTNSEKRVKFEDFLENPLDQEIEKKKTGKYHTHKPEDCYICMYVHTYT